MDGWFFFDRVLGWCVDIAERFWDTARGFGRFGITTHYSTVQPIGVGRIKEARTVVGWFLLVGVILGYC